MKEIFLGNEQLLILSRSRDTDNAALSGGGAELSCIECSHRQSDVMDFSVTKICHWWTRRNRIDPRTPLEEHGPLQTRRGFIYCPKQPAACEHTGQSSVKL